jgi:hypothetical protein
LQNIIGHYLQYTHSQGKEKTQGISVCQTFIP